MNTKLKLLAFLACALGAATLAGNFGAQAETKPDAAESKHAAATAKPESPHAAKAESPPTVKKSRVFGDQAGSGQNSGQAPAGHGAKPQQAASTADAAAPQGAPKGEQPKGAHGTVWGYSGPSSPRYWGDLDPEYRLCQAGKMQSPIDMTETTDAVMSEIKFDYQITLLKIVNNGHTVQVNYAKGSSVSIDGKTYELLQFHFHTPSEHTVEGKPFAVEMHLVHKNAEGELAVVAVFMQPGKDNIALQEVWNHLPRQAGGAKTIASVAVNARDLVPANAAYYRYMGSLTTPPCSEGVNWYVLKTPIEVGKEQIRALADIMGANNRPTQGLANRLLLAAH
ncbi:MAG: carbonic anhydrase family protein [Proteobacteria bacterium]|nr:carbonic anhydrase family protein [Pseudomonadota bacterium]